MARPIQRLENYTTPALVMGLVNLMGLLMAVWVLFGFMAALLIGLVLNQAITRLEHRKNQR